MGHSWYCRLVGQEFGPLTIAEVADMARQGGLAPDDEVREGTDGAWRPAASFAEFAPAWISHTPLNPEALNPEALNPEARLPDEPRAGADGEQGSLAEFTDLSEFTLDAPAIINPGRPPERPPTPPPPTPADERWYFQSFGNVLGPTSRSELAGLAQRGELAPEDLVRRDTDQGWVAARSLPEFFTFLASPGLSDEATDDLAAAIHEDGDSFPVKPDAAGVAPQTAGRFTATAPSTFRRGGAAGTKAGGSNPPPPQNPASGSSPSRAETMRAAVGDILQDVGRVQVAQKAAPRRQGASRDSLYERLRQDPRTAAVALLLIVMINGYFVVPGWLHARRARAAYGDFLQIHDELKAARKMNPDPEQLAVVEQLARRVQVQSLKLKNAPRQTPGRNLERAGRYLTEMIELMKQGSKDEQAACRTAEENFLEYMKRIAVQLKM